MNFPLSEKKTKASEVLVHVLVWFFILGFPFLFLDHRSSNSVDVWKMFLRFSEMPCYLMVIFYLNYFWLVPSYLFKGRTREYLLWNGFFVLLLGVMLHVIPWDRIIEQPRPRRMGRADGPPPPHRMKPPMWLFLIRNIIMLALAAAFSATIRMTSRLRSTEMARQEAEKSKSEAELKNLKNQLSPHFLLNTLNNIYALILFDANKAQEAVLDLGKLLRYVLYENQSDFVPLYKEVDFIRNYIDLMRIRLAENVKVETSFHISPESETPIAPLLFISLIENAFKHGTSPEQESYILIALEEKKGESVTCFIENSNHPKNKNDKSGSGIGLEQVRVRLELLYPGRYQWECGVSADGTRYSSTLIISLKPNKRRLS